MAWFSKHARGKFTIPMPPTVARRIALRILLAHISLSIITIAGFAQNRPASSVSSPSRATLTTETPIELTLNPTKSVTVALQLPAGLYSEIRIQQIHGMNQSVLVDPEGHASTPHTNDGGIGSVERFSIVPVQGGTFHLQIQSRERHTPVVFRITLLPGRTPQPRDTYMTQAENTLAEAEWIRRKSSFKSFPGVRGPSDVLALYDRAFQLALQAGDIALERDSLTGKARYQIFRIEQYQQGVQAATRATQLPAFSPDIDQQALAWKTLASALAFISRYDASIAASQHALALYRTTGDRYWQGIVLGDVASIYLETGDSTKALEAAQGSLDMAQQLSDDYGVAFTQMTIGEIYQFRGQYQKALSAYYPALDTANRISYPQVEGEVWNDLGQIYSQLGDWERAADAYSNALPILQKDGDGINEIAVLGQLGELALHAGHLRQAREYFRKGLTRAESQKLVREETFLRIGLARTCAQTHCAQDPLKTLSQAGDAARQIHQIDGEATADAAMGDVLAARHNNSGAKHAYLQSAALWRQIPNSSELAAVEAGMARLDDRQGQLLAARLEIYDALRAIEASRAHIDSDALRTSYFTSKRSYYDLAVNVLMQLNRISPQHGYAAEAWTVAERARARTLLDDLQEGRQQETSVSGRQLQQEDAVLELKIHDTEDRLSRLGSSPSDIARAQQLQQKVHDMLLHADQLEARIRASNPAYHTLVKNGSTSPSEFSHTVLDDKTALLEYWTGNLHSYLWVITDGGMRSFRLPDRASLDALVHSYQQSMLARDRYVGGEDLRERQLRIGQSDTRLSAQSRKLAAILLPGNFSPRIRRLLIVADGSLLSMPFAALELPHLQTTASRYLIERYDLVYEPSASVATALHAERSQSPDSRRIAIFADPVYSDTDARVKIGDTEPVAQASQPSVLRQASIERFSGLPRLPASRNEAMAMEQIAGAPNTSLFLGFDASPQTVEKIDWKPYLVAHFAAHAIVDTEHPEFSGIVLSMVHRDGAPADGVLWLHDIYRLNIPVSLVTLSGCQTADGKPIPGEGINGLSRAFLYAGARSVIGTLWDAEDSSSSELMQRFYRTFFSKRPAAAAALRDAQLHVLSVADHRAPYYWAGFVLEGDWQGR